MLLRDRYPVTAAFVGIPISIEDSDEDTEFRFSKRTRDFPESVRKLPSQQTLPLTLRDSDQPAIRVCVCCRFRPPHIHRAIAGMAAMIVR